jgi:hypothetical protein
VKTRQKLLVLSLALSVSLLALCLEGGRLLFGSQLRCRAIALADLDGDGDLDAFLANGQSEMFEPNQAWLNRGTGRFVDSGQRLGKLNSYSVALGDFDADGDVDALVGNSASGEVFNNDGAGRFVSKGQWPHPQDAGVHRWVVTVGDLDGDGDLDAYLGGCCGGIASGENWTSVLYPYNVVWLNDGAGDFDDTGQRMGDSGTRAIALGDLDGDGDLDAFVGNSSSIVDTNGTARRNEPNKVWLNDGSGQFDDSGQSLGSASTYALALGDVDGDGDLDAFVGNEGANEVWLNDGHGNYNDSGQTLGDASTQVVNLADVDGDGDVDALVGNDKACEIWLNDGTGTFGDSSQRLSYSEGYVVAPGDLDGDGDQDVLAGKLGKRLWAWLNDGTGKFQKR